jgi:hypothetical protein
MVRRTSTGVKRPMPSIANAGNDVFREDALVFGEFHGRELESIEFFLMSRRIATKHRGSKLVVIAVDRPAAITM